MSVMLTRVVRAAAFFCLSATLAGCPLIEDNDAQEDPISEPEPGCQPGIDRPADDGCNTCFCTEDGQWACTEMACEQPPPPRCAEGEALVDGECRTGCYSDQDCGVGAYCTAETECMADPSCPECEVCYGYCAPVVPPPACDCPAVWAPVCGEDGQTYGNACEAECAGVDAEHEGECAEPAPAPMP